MEWYQILKENLEDFLVRCAALIVITVVGTYFMGGPEQTVISVHDILTQFVAIVVVSSLWTILQTLFTK